MNLLTNAFKYTPAGGTVQVKLTSTPQTVVISIADNGLGIDKDKLTAVFNMFTQAHPDEEMSRSGLGIGLNLSKALVEMHKGQIEARSQGRGKGSEFVVRFPATSAC